MGLKRCFTLLELILVITIICIVVGITLPYFKKNLDKLRHDEFVRRVYLFLDNAKTYSQLYSRNTKIEINGKKEIMIEVMENEEYKPIEARYSNLVLPRDITINSEEPSVIFYPDATCTDFSWDIFNKAERIYTVKGSGFNGKFEIIKY